MDWKYSTGVRPGSMVSVNHLVVRGSSELWMWNRVPWARAQAFWGTRDSRLLEKHWSGPGTNTVRRQPAWMARALSRRRTASPGRSSSSGA